MAMFIMKHINSRKPQKPMAKAECTYNENKDSKKKSVMNTDEKVAMAQSILAPSSNTKRIKKDKGLIERTESSKTILTDDNKELLID